MRSFFLAAAVAFAASASAQTLHPMAQELPVKIERKITAPLTFTAGLPTLTVMINGKGPFKLGFDTGSMGGVHLTTGAVEKLGLRETGQAFAGDPTGKNPQRISMFADVSVDLGGKTLSVGASSSPPMKTDKLAALDGIVGPELVGASLITVDYAHATFNAEPAALPDADGKTIFAYTGPIPRVPVTIEGLEIEAYLDTGNVRAGLILPEAAAAKLSNYGAATSVGTAYTVSNAIEMKAVTLTKPPSVGGIALPVSEIQFPSVGAANVGSAALQALVVRVDVRNHRVQLAGN